MSHPTKLILLTLLLVALMLDARAPVQAQDNDMVWQYREANGTAGVGRKSAGLILGVPETDHVQVQAGCDSSYVRSGKSISLVLGADVGTLKDGDKIKVQFTGGRFKRTLDGIVHGTTLEEGVSGAHVQIAPGDRLWEVMQERDGLEYQVPGYQVATLKLSGGASTIQRFVATCNRYARRAGGGSGKASKKSSTSNVRVAGKRTSSNEGVDEKEAFESAKELGTIEGWEAFLKSFPSGFRADLARAYVKRLGGSGTNGTGQASTNTATRQRHPDSKTKVPLLDTFESRPGTLAWRTTRYDMDEGNTSTKAAAVKANGVELLFHCDGKRLAGVVREYGRGLYPNFDVRVQQGLAAKRQGRDAGDPVPIPMEFSDGRTFSVGANVMGLTGEVSLSRRSDGRGFKADGSLIATMMSEDTVTISAPPFVANVQLKKSRPALCSLIRSCGARAEGCGTRKTYTKKKTIKKKKKKRACRPSGASCTSHSQCCGRKCCLTDFEECEGIGGTCDG